MTAKLLVAEIGARMIPVTHPMSDRDHREPSQQHDDAEQQVYPAPCRRTDAVAAVDRLVEEEWSMTPARASRDQKTPPMIMSVPAKTAQPTLRMLRVGIWLDDI